MATFNWKVFKKGKPVYWVLGAIVLFVIFYLIASRGAGASSSGSSGGVTTISSGPSDAAISANAAQTIASYDLAAKQSEQNANVAIAGIAAKVQELDLTSQVAALRVQSEYSLESAKVAAQTDLAIAGVNLQGLALQTGAQLESQRIASQGDIAIAALQVGLGRDQIAGAVAQTAIQADVAKFQMSEGTKQIQAQLETNAAMFAKSVESQTAIARVQTLASVASGVNAKDRDNAFALLLAAETGQPISYRDNSTGSFTYGSTAPAPSNSGSGGFLGIF